MKWTARLLDWTAKTFRLQAFNLDGTGYHSTPSTSTGLWVDRNSALTSGAFFGCLNLTATAIGYLGFDVYRERRSGGADVASDHPLHNLLKWEPNEHSTACEFLQAAIYDLELCGNDYSRIVRNSDGVLGLVPWDSNRVKINADNAAWVYEYSPDRGEMQRVAEWDGQRQANILHLRNVSIDGIYGLSIVDLARQRIGLDLAVERYGAAFFGKGGRVKDIFEFPGTLTPEQRGKFKRVFQEEYGNADRFHEAMILEANIKLAGKSGANPNEAQFLETQTQTAISICRFFGIPPTLLGILDRATYNNQEQLMLQFLTLCLGPRVDRLEKAFRRALLTPTEKRQGYYIHSKVQKLLRADTKTRSEFYKTLATLGAISQNDIRDLEDMPRIPDPSADEYRQAANLFGPDEAAVEAEPEPPTEESAQRAAA